MALWQWSKTSTSNSTSDPTMNWSEGIPPSIVDDNVRAMMARIAEWRDDTAGLIFSGGTAPSYTVTTNQGFPSTPSTGQLLAFVASQTNVGGDTLACDGGGAYPIELGSGAGIPAGTLISGTPYTMVFNGSAWAIRDFYGTPFVVPVGGMIDWTLTFVPSSNFAFPAGQAVSRTTYAQLFTAYNSIGLPYGAGDGVTTFNLIDMRGRYGTCLDVLPGTGQGNAGRIGTTTTDSGTIVGATIGSTGGSATHVQTSSEMASHSHTGSGNVSDPQHFHTLANSVPSTGAGSGATNTTGVSNNTLGQTQSASTGISVPSLNINNAGSSAAMSLLPPTIMLTKILRIL